MTKILYPTAFSLWEDEERAAIARVHASGRYTMAGEVEAFEAEAAAYHGRKHGIMVNSGSSANLIATAAAHLRANGDWNEPARSYAFVPAVAWSTTYAPLAQLGYNLVPFDVDDTWNALPPDYTGTVSRPLPAVIVLCSILGNPAHFDRWAAYPDLSYAILIEDNCESLGAAMAGGRKTGTFGLASTLSFFYSHQVSAIEGGMVLTDDDAFAQTCRLLRNHGNAGWGRDDPEELYDFTAFGYNVRPLELHAAIGRAQLAKLDRFVDVRRENELVFWQKVERYDLPLTAPTVNGLISPFGIAFRVPSREVRKRLFAALRAEGVDARPPTGGSFTRHAYGAPWREDHPTPNADLIHDTGMFLGNAPFPIPDLIDRAVGVIRRTL